jgi:ATP-dependent Clp protease ATP-binding subunit ClpC
VRAPDFDPARQPEAGTKISALITPRLHQILGRAAEEAEPCVPVSPTDLLAALVDEPDNLGIRILQALGVDVPSVREAARPGPPLGRDGRAGGDRARRRSRSSAGATDRAGLQRLSIPAWLAVAAALEASTELGHAFLGSEHLLAGLAGPDGGEAAEVLRTAGADAEAVRRAIPAAVAGATLGYKQADRLLAPTVADRLEDVTARLAGLEARLDAAGL